MHAVDPVSDPVLRKTIDAIVMRKTRHLPSGESSEVRRDLTQELRLQVLELHKHYRGDNGATFATFIYRALSLHAYHVLQSYQSPVKAGRNNQDRWKMQRVYRPGPSTENHRANERADNLDTPEAFVAPDPMDLLAAPSERVDDALAEASVGAHLRQLARRHIDHAAIEAVVFDEEPYESVSARTGRPIRDLRRVVRDYREKVAKDPGLRALYATR